MFGGIADGKHWLLAALLAFAPTAFAGQSAARVAEVTSDAPVTDVAAWVASIAPVAMAYTDAHNVEVCGVIARDPSGRLGIILGTTDSPAGCGFSHRNVPEGFASTGETFHTHPHVDQRGRVRMTMAQRRKFGDFAAAAKDFSPQDYRDGPGYVYTSGMLLYQHGAGTRVVVGQEE